MAEADANALIKLATSHKRFFVNEYKYILHPVPKIAKNFVKRLEVLNDSLNIVTPTTVSELNLAGCSTTEE